MNMGRYDYITKWRKENARRFEFYINKEEDELIEWFNTIPNKSALIIELLKKEKKKRGKKVQEN